MSSNTLSPDFRLIFEASPDVAVLLLPDFTIVAASESYLQSTMKEKTIIGRNLFDVFPENPEDLQSHRAADIRASFEKAAQNGKPDALPPIQYDMERPGEPGGFEKRYWQLKAVPIFCEIGSLQYFIQRVEDITEAFHSELELQDARLRLETALEAGEIGTWIFDITNNCVYADKSLANLFSVSEEDAAGGKIETYLKAIHPEDKSRVEATIGESILNSDSYEAEYRIVQPDNSVRWVIARGNILRDEQGKAERLPGVVIDNSDRKKAENAQFETQNRLELVSRAANDAIWDWNLLTDEVWWNEGVMEMFGYAPEQVENTADWWYRHIHPEDRERVVSGIHEVIDQGVENWSDEYCYLCADGSCKHVLDRGFAIQRDEQPIRMLGSMQDMSSRKANEKDLRESRERLQIVLDASQIGLWYCDLPFDVLNWSNIDAL